MRRRKSLRKALLVLLALVAVLWILCCVWPAMRFKREVQAKLAGADRVIVDFNPLPFGDSLRSKWAGLPNMEIVGRERVQELVGLLQFRSWPPPGHCRCFGELGFRFEAAGQPLGTLTLHHDESLRWCSLDRSICNHELTSTSRDVLHQWLERNGGDAYHDAERRADAFWAELRRQREQEDERALASQRAATSSSPE